MNMPEATSLLRSVSESCSEAAGGGKTYGKMKNPTATPSPVPSTPPRTKIEILRQSLFIGHSPVVWDGSVGGGYFQANGEQSGSGEREPNAAATGRPADSVEDLTEDSGADQAAGEIAGQIDAARRSAIRGRGPAHEARRS